MVALEDTLNIGMCGLFLFILAALCFVAFSALTVKYFHFILTLITWNLSMDISSSKRKSMLSNTIHLLQNVGLRS